ncbi:MAG: flavodoxin domain-containing protein [Cyclobacteriaceae bacterium]|nr:flavodoxin domain-containing protein [Cyclobacteriaceae bacterium SS2]
MDQSGSSLLTILYGTETGHAESIAKLMASKAKVLGISSSVRNMADFDTSDFHSVRFLAVIISTHGIGEPPISSERLFYRLKSKPDMPLNNIRYALLALGDSEYALFCQAGKDFDLMLRQHGAQSILPRIDCDVDFEQDAMNWISDFLGRIKS